MKISRLLNSYETKKKEIKNRLKEFKRKKSDKKIFSELCFCLLTPQSKARICDRAIKKLEKSGLLFSMSEKQILPELKGVRFANKKSNYIVEARKLSDIKNTREWLVENVKGLGYKESSHFLRNIGLGDNIAILDRHILKNLKELGVIKEIPKTLTKKKYLEIEEKMRAFSKSIGIPLDEMDLLLWSEETGEIFK